MWLAHANTLEIFSLCGFFGLHRSNRHSYNGDGIACCRAAVGNGLCQTLFEGIMPTGPGMATAEENMAPILFLFTVETSQNLPGFSGPKEGGGESEGELEDFDTDL